MVINKFIVRQAERAKKLANNSTNINQKEVSAVKAI